MGIINKIFNYFGNVNTYNPFRNSIDGKNILDYRFSIPTVINFVDTPAIAVDTGLVINIDYFLNNLNAEILETNGTLITALSPKFIKPGDSDYPNINEIVWFDVEGMQGSYWVNPAHAGKVLKLSGKFETTSITAEAMNKISSDISNVPNVIKQNPPPIGATYTQWDINAPAPQNKWVGTTWQVVSRKKVLFKESVFVNGSSETTHILDNRTISIECDCIGGAVNESSVRYNNRWLVRGRRGLSGGSGGGYGKGYLSEGGYHGGSSGHASDGKGVGAGGGGNGVSGGSAGSASRYGDSEKGQLHGRGGSYYFEKNISMAGVALIYNEPIFEFSDFVPGVRNFLYYVGAKGGDGGGRGMGAAGVIAFREYTNETVFVRTA